MLKDMLGHDSTNNYMYNSKVHVLSLALKTEAE